MPLFGRRSAKKAAVADAPPDETEEEKRLREAEEERQRIKDQADLGSSYTRKGKKTRKQLMDEAGDI
jgi:hypothetical protein